MSRLHLPGDDGMSYVGMEAAVNHRFSGSAAGMGMCF